jgi:hypothetical protein
MVAEIASIATSNNPMEPAMPRAYLAPYRSIAAIELRNAGSLRRDMVAGLLPRAAAISAIRECLRHAQCMNVSARILGQV